MAKLTRAQYERWNSKALGGFNLDAGYFINWGEKTLRKIVDLPDGNYIEFCLTYYAEYKTITNEWGCSYKVETGRQLPTLTVQKWYRRENVSESYGLGKHYTVGAPEARKNFDTLCKLSGAVDCGEYMKEYA